ncbi:hypothetical protein Tco_1312537 [Tanacetum coccineum]
MEALMSLWEWTGLQKEVCDKKLYSPFKAHLDLDTKDQQVYQSHQRDFNTRVEQRSKNLIPLKSSISMSANDDFSLHDDEELSLHDDASLAGSVPASNKGDAPAKPPQIITTNTLSNIKLPVLQKDDYDTWAMEKEHYL